MSLLTLAKNTVTSALKLLHELDVAGTKKYKFSNEIPREIKADADLIIEQFLIKELSKSDINILSEESGYINNQAQSETNLKFIIDPIDGTVNFVRNLGSCSISIALFDGDKPIFGVLGSYPGGSIAWGGKDIGAFEGYKPLKVSTIDDASKGILCTGFPSRFAFNSKSKLEQMTLMQNFGKVRMLGSASQSLLKVAQGSAEAYVENDIMIWDVAAGVAIVEGAGGKVDLTQKAEKGLLAVKVTNNIIKEWD